MIPPSTSRTVALLVVASLVLAPVAVAPTATASVADSATAPAAPASITTPGDATTTDERHPPNGTPPNVTVAVHRGDVVTVPVRTLPDRGGEIVLTPASGEGYGASVDVDDEDGDGWVRLRVNTYLLGRGSPADGFTALGPDEVVDVSESTTGSVPEAGEYRLEVVTDTMVPNVDYTGLVRLREREVRGVAAWTAAPDVEIEDPADIARLRSSGRLVASETVVLGEPLVLAVNATGIEGAVVAGTNATDGFFDAFAGENATFQAEQTMATTPPEQVPMVLALADPDATHVVADSASDTYYLVVDTAAMRATDDDHERDYTDRLYGSLGYQESIGFRIRAAFLQYGGTDEARIRSQGNATVSFVGPRVRLDAERIQDRREREGLVWLRPAPDQRVTGTTTLAPGRSVTVTLGIPRAENRSRTVRVDENQTFAATFDLTGVPDGTNLTVRASPVVDTDLGEDPLREADDVVRARVDVPSAAIVLADQETTVGRYEGEVVVANVSLSRGGFVAIHRDSADGDRLGVSTYLEPGVHENVTVHEPAFTEPGSTTVVAVVHRDADRDHEFDPARDPPYQHDGTPVRASAVVEATTPNGSEFPCISDDVGGRALVVSSANESEARAAADGDPPIVAGLEGDRRAAVRAAIEKDCSVALDGIAVPDAVVYRGEYYLLAIAHASTTTTTVPPDSSTTTSTSVGTSSTRTADPGGGSDQPVPGFGPLVALLALLSALFAARRRR